MRTAVTILFVAVLALGLGWLCWSNGGGAMPVEFVFPPDGQPPLVTPPVATAANAPYDASVLIRVQPRARILPPAQQPRVVVMRGAEELSMSAGVVAGIGAAGGRVPDGGGRALVRLEPGTGAVHWR